MAETSQVVIVGGGVAGCSVAYHLALAGVKATVIEREGIATPPPTMTQADRGLASVAGWKA